MRVLRSPYGAVVSDEATSGLMALEILRGHLPVVLEGQAYSGTIESFLVAPVFGLFGTSNAVLKVVPIAFWALSSVLCYLVLRRPVGVRVAAAAAVVLWIPSGSQLIISTRAFPGYVSGLAAGLATILLAAVVAERAPGTLGWRPAAATGFLAGTTFWLHPMLACLAAPAVAVAAVRHRRDVRAWWVPSGAAAAVALAPFGVYNVANGFPALSAPDNGLESTYLERLEIFVAQLLPRTLGMRTPDGRWILGETLGKIVFLAVAAMLAWGMLVLARRGWSGRVLVAVALAALPIMALFDALAYYEDARYGMNLVPIIAFGVAGALASVPARVRTLAAGALPVAWVLLFVNPHLGEVAVPHPIDPHGPLEAVVAELDAAGIDRVYADYFVAQRITFQTDERIQAASAFPLERFPVYTRRVGATPPERVGYVFSPGMEHPDLLQLGADRYRRLDVSGYAVYIPLAG